MAQILIRSRHLLPLLLLPLLSLSQRCLLPPTTRTMTTPAMTLQTPLVSTHYSQSNKLLPLRKQLLLS